VKNQKSEIMKLNYYISFVFSSLLFSLSSCSHSDNPERNKAYDEMMAIHDEVMPEMGTIHRLEKGLKKKIENTSSPDSLVMIKATLQRLSDSGDSMMDWMHNLDVPGKKVPDDEAIAYLKLERDKISTVSTRMKKSIESSKALLGQ